MGMGDVVKLPHMPVCTPFAGGRWPVVRLGPGPWLSGMSSCVPGVQPSKFCYTSILEFYYILLLVAGHTEWPRCAAVQSYATLIVVHQLQVLHLRCPGKVQCGCWTMHVDLQLDLERCSAVEAALDHRCRQSTLALLLNC